MFDVGIAEAPEVAFAVVELVAGKTCKAMM
jgi:hypothetical protein